MSTVPTGLDGNPDPIQTRQRTAVIAAVGEAIGRVEKDRVLVAVDGASGVGKSTFADELGRWLSTAGRAIVRSTTDSFHRPRAQRYQRGHSSSAGYFLDSHDLVTIQHGLLEPFRAGAPRVMVSAFDEPTDTVAETFADVGEHAVLIFDGLFLLRHELRPYWDLTMHLLAAQRRETAWTSYLHGDLPEEPRRRADEIARRLERARWPRYHEGWQLYVDEADPEAVADIVIDNDHFANPMLARR
jgi:uridine kinase